MTQGDYYSRPRPEMRALVPPSARTILDVGCGGGAFAAGLKQDRADAGGDDGPARVWGIELDPAAASAAAGRLDRVLQGDALQKLPELPDAGFDCIVLNDILEHLVEPELLLRGLGPKLAPGGRLVASIPNVRHFPHLWGLVVHGEWEYTDEGILDRTHLRFFTRGSLEVLFRGCGYQLERVAGIHPTGSLKYHLVNLLTLGRWSDMRYLQFACVARREGVRQGEEP